MTAAARFWPNRSSKDRTGTSAATGPQPKVGVLTFHRCINYGSYWQARCLVEGLRARGHDAVILDHRSRRVDAAEWKCALQPVLPACVPWSDRLRYGIKMLRFFRAFASLPLSRPFALDDPGSMPKYEEVVVGSDEVWSLRHPWYGGCALFYGDGVKARRLTAYAASFGSHSAWEGLPPAWADRLRRFESISVRDENSWWMLKHALGLEPALVLDPCLQFPGPIKQVPSAKCKVQSEGDRIGSGGERHWRGPNGPFVAIYGHSFSPAFAAGVRRWARSRGLPLVSIGYRNPWADVQWLTAGPHDFAQSIARAQAVATNFFHGCIFSLLNARPFVCEPSTYRSIKVQDLMRTVGGERHLVSAETPDAAYDATLGAPLDPAILRRIDDLRQASEAYLHVALGAGNGKSEARAARAAVLRPQPVGAGSSSSTVGAGVSGAGD